ncbi:MAG: GTPase Era [Eggerthellaceae bacterium]|nr:GTPase Era [Eggerthellaceae bacterium]
MQMALDDKFKSGFVSVIGRPNAGKSTLINTLTGKKLSITSSKPQTTRRSIRAVKNGEDYQIVFVDTPGFHKAKDRLGVEQNKFAMSSLSDVDIIIMMIDASKKVGSGDRWVASQIEKIKSKKICVLSKREKVGKDVLHEQIQEADKLSSWDAFVVLSSFTGNNLDALIEEIYEFLPEGSLWFPQDMDTDQPLEMMLSEVIREKIFRNFDQEVPYAIGVKIADMYESDNNVLHIYADVFTERESQKSMVVGKGGQAIKKIGIQAREDLEKILLQKIYLDIKVKVKSRWRGDYESIIDFGYAEES